MDYIRLRHWRLSETVMLTGLESRGEVGPMYYLSKFDDSIVTYINSFMGKSLLFDKLMLKMDSLSLIKTGLFAAFLFYVWFREEGDWCGDRPFVIRTLIGVVVAIAVSRAMQELLPHRVRPMFEPTLKLRLPSDLRTYLSYKDNSFPSDTTTLATALATAVYMQNRLLGLLAAAIVILASILTKLYLGYHYPSDIVGGILIGIVCMKAAHSIHIPDAGWRLLLRLHDAYRGIFYAVMFIAFWQIATLFNDIRLIGRGILEILGAALAAVTR